MFKLPKIALIAFSFLIGVSAVLITTTVLAHGGDTNLIHGCVKSSNGSLRIVGANDTCGNGETALDWNIQGPQGPPGTNTLPFICTHCIFVDTLEEEKDDFANAILLQSSFLGDDLSNVDFSNSNLRRAYFENDDLTDANFSGTDLKLANFNTGVNLQDVNFTNANLKDGNIDALNNISGVIWLNTICPDGTNSDSNGNTCEGHLVP